MIKSTADAVIVGGGVMGCSILYNLAARGMTNSVLLEKDVLAFGSTSRSQAILRTHYSNKVMAEMAWESLRLFKEFKCLTGISSGYTRTGYLLIVGQKDRLALETNVAMQQRVGIETNVVSPESAREMFPMLSIEYDEAFAWEPMSGYANPYSVTIGYAKRARELGAVVQTSSPVTEIEVAGGKVRAVLSEDGRIETPIAVIAAGPWSSSLLEKIGVNAPLRTIRHQVVVLRRPKDIGPVHPVIGDVANDLSARPEIGNLTLVGIGEEESVGADEYNQGVDMPMVEKAFSGLARRIPEMSKAQFKGGWSGLFTVTPDWHPILDRISGIDGLYCAVGFSGHGFKLAPMVGLAMSELITDGQFTTTDISVLGMERFTNERSLASGYRMRVLA